MNLPGNLHATVEKLLGVNTQTYYRFLVEESLSIQLHDEVRKGFPLPETIVTESGLCLHDRGMQSDQSRKRSKWG